MPSLKPGSVNAWPWSGTGPALLSLSDWLGAQKHGLWSIVLQIYHSNLGVDGVGIMWSYPNIFIF